MLKTLIWEAYKVSIYLLVDKHDNFPFFVPSMYEYMCGKDVCNIVPDVNEIPDAQLKSTLVEVCMS